MRYAPLLYHVTLACVLRQAPYWSAVAYHTKILRAIHHYNHLTAHSCQSDKHRRRFPTSESASMCGSELIQNHGYALRIIAMTAIFKKGKRITPKCLFFQKMLE